MAEAETKTEAELKTKDGNTNRVATPLGQPRAGGPVTNNKKQTPTCPRNYPTNPAIEYVFVGQIFVRNI